ncbi:MAG: hypothetical protein GX340_08655 [Clostridiales bacterium]|jgi:hypothetical protein|nr:hypothetical protein [Clostridiales bacterium]
MREEVKKILKMIEDGHITAEEGERLLDAMNDHKSDESLNHSQDSGSNPRFLKVRIAEEGKNKVNVTIPISLIEVGLKIGAKVGPLFTPEAEVLQDVDLEELMQAIREGARGKLVDVQDDDNQVEIFVE